jgi:lysophospholipase L1-like esterase
VWTRFVALGDSFTEGLDDPAPSGGFQGWADRLAERLALGVPDLQYANLAVRGRLLGPILTEQVPAALAMRPDLVTLAGGGNDILRPRCDLEDLGQRFRSAVGELAGTGATVLVFAGFDPVLLPLGSRLRRRAVALNTHARRAALDHGTLLVDLWNLAELRDPAVWSEDRLHLNAKGHGFVAAAVAEALGLPRTASTTKVADARGTTSAVTTAAGANAPADWLSLRRQDASWTARHLLPWVGRRIRGRSSGDGISAKRPELAPVAAPPAP